MPRGTAEVLCCRVTDGSQSPAGGLWELRVTGRPTRGAPHTSHGLLVGKAPVSWEGELGPRTPGLV